MPQRKRNELVAGVFILVALAALAVVLALVYDWEGLGQRTVVYYVRFDQAPGIRVGSQVLLGGMPKGRVVSEDITWERDGSTFYYVFGLEVPEEVRLRRDAEIVIEGKFIGEGAAINIAKVGTVESAGASPDDPIQGRSGSMMEVAAEALGIHDEQREQIARTLARVDTITEQISGMTPKLTAAAENINNFTSSLSGAGAKVSTTLDRIDSITSNVDERLPSILTSVDEGAGKIKSAATQLDGILIENRDKLKTSVDNLASATQSMGTAAEGMVAATQDIRSLIAANRMNVTGALVNVRQTSEQLKAASIEIRRAPWRLLYRPDEREADSLNLFDASRNYATAVADLRSTANTLQTLAELKKADVPVDEQLLREMVDRLRAGLNKYDEAESALWKQWGEAGK